MNKYLYAILILLVAHSVQAADVTWPDKTTGGTFTAADANELKTAVNSKADETELTAHTSDTGNPHSLTAAQLGVYTTAQVDALLTALENKDIASGVVSGSTLTITRNDGSPLVITGLPSGDGGTDDQTAGEVSVTDSGENYTGSNVETILTEIAALLDTIPTVDNTAYNATSWDGNTDAATKDAIRDKLESLATDSGATIDDSAGNGDTTVAYSADKIVDGLALKMDLWDYDYSDLINTPTIPTNNNELTNGAGFITSYTETDPVFLTYPAAGILAGDITHWNNAYGWGNHAEAGYLTSYTETDPSFTAWGYAYSSLVGTPDIPTDMSDLNDDVGYLTETAATTASTVIDAFLRTETEAAARASIDAQEIMDADDVAGLFSGTGDYLKADGSTGTPTVGSFAFDTFPTYEDSPHASGLAYNSTHLAFWNGSKWLTIAGVDTLDATPTAGTISVSPTSWDPADGDADDVDATQTFTITATGDVTLTSIPLTTGTFFAKDGGTCTGTDALSDSSCTVIVDAQYVTGAGTYSDTLTINSNATNDSSLDVALGPVTVSAVSSAITDDFNRSDGGLGSNWTTASNHTGTLNIASNTVASDSDNAAMSVYTGSTFDDDQYGQIETGDFSGYQGVGCRGNSEGDGYALLSVGTASVRVYRLDDGGRNTLATYSGDYSYQTLRLECNGTTITAYADDIELGDSTDSTYSSGSPFIYSSSYTSATSLDNFEGGDL